MMDRIKALYPISPETLQKKVCHSRTWKEVKDKVEQHLE
jgi:hypothetical protein